MTSLSQRYSRPADPDLGVDQHLPPLLPAGATLDLCQRELAPRWRQRFLDMLGRPNFQSGDYDPAATVMDRFHEDELFIATLYRQPTGPGHVQQVLLLEPREPARGPRPAALVPFYHPDDSAGFDLDQRQPRHDRTLIAFGRQLARQGYVVMCTEAFPFNTVPAPADQGNSFNWWRLAAAKLLADHPHWTGMGKLLHDTRRALDLLLEQPDIDRDRVVVMGHSLGGKMAFYTGCLDPRVRATVANDFGIGWSFTNWRDPWYLGTRLAAPGFDLAHHQLLALHAPRPMFLIAGEADRRESWQYLLAAQEVYGLFGQAHALGGYHHGSGHDPTPQSLDIAYAWLAERFDLPCRPWR